MTETIKPGNTHEFSTQIFDEDGEPWNLASASVIETIRSLNGTEVYEHTLIVDAFGVASVEDGIVLVGDAINGQIERQLTSIETAALDDGWYRYDLDLIDTTGNRYDIEDGAWKIKSGSSYVAETGMTRKNIRRRVLSRLGDLLVVTATSTGTDTTLVDARNLIGEPDSYRGRFIRFTGGTVANIGEIRYISGSSRSTRTITLDDALPSATAVGDEAEIANIRGTGYRFQDVDMAIDAAFEAAADFALEQVSYTAGTYDEDTPYIDIPPTWVSISGVDWQDPDTLVWSRMSYHHRKYGDGWTLDRPGMRVYISGETSARVNGGEIRLIGQDRPTIPVNDDDRTNINSEWIIARCVSELSSSAYRRMPTPDRERVMGYDLQNEQSVRSRVTKRSSPNTLRLK
jgi:hypothetical protein